MLDARKITRQETGDQVKRQIVDILPDRSMLAEVDESIVGYVYQ